MQQKHEAPSSGTAQGRLAVGLPTLCALQPMPPQLPVEGRTLFAQTWTQGLGMSENLELCCPDPL